MWKEFKAFVNQGNALDLAVGVVIGAAFGKIVNSLVNDIIMPLVGLLTGGVDFADRFVALNGQDYATLDAAKAAKAPVLAYGVFINTIVEFLIVAFSIFLVVRQMNKWRGTAPAPPKA
jgi:large conductance mechanosensitive channel